MSPARAGAARRLAPLLLAIALLPVACTRPPDAAGWSQGAAPAAERTLTVLGTGRFSATPTRLDLDAIIETTAAGADGAWQQGTDRMFKLTRALETAGVRTADMTPVDAQLRNTATSYVLTQRLRITVRDLQKAAAVLATAQGNSSRLEGVRFALDGKAAGDRARERALLDAGDKAQMLAQEMQLRLGPVRSVEELSVSTPTEGGTLQDPPPPLETTSQLRVCYALLD
jgi:uncharacterized protein YggE